MKIAHPKRKLSQRPKAPGVNGLAPQAPKQPESVSPEGGTLPPTDDPAELAIRQALGLGRERLLEALPTVVEGLETGIHRMRTSARRLRSALRVYEPMLDSEWARNLAAELKWLAGSLGTVRDLDVQIERLRTDAGELTKDLAPLFQTLDDRLRSARSELIQALDSPRFANLLKALSEAAERPAVRDRSSAPIESTLTPLSAKAWKKLKVAGRSLRPGDPADSYHEARILAKRARYCVEAIAPALGPWQRKAERFADRAAALQSVLGESQDATVAQDLMKSIVTERPAGTAFAVAIGRMIERQARAGAQARAQFAKSWEALDQPRVYRWFRSARQG